MRWFVRFVLLFGVLGLSAEARGGLRVATYNLRNYLIMDRYVDGSWRPDYPKPESEKAALREAILAVRPDVLFVQEMGTHPFLEELRTDLAEAGLRYAYWAHMQSVDEVRHLAALSRIPFAEVVKHNDLDFKYFDRRERVKRGLLELRFEDGQGGELQLFTLHLKSRWTEDAEDPEAELRRAREAEACRNRLIERTLDVGRVNYMVAGDFNDHTDSAALRRFYRRGDLEIARRLPALDREGLSWTYFYQKHHSYETLDGILVSDALRPAVVGGEAVVFGETEVLRGSDHRMVYVDLIWPLP